MTATRNAAALAGTGRRYLAALTEDLSARSAVDPVLRPFADQLAGIATDAVQRGPFPWQAHPAMAHLEPALAAADGAPALLDAAIEAARILDWHQVYAGGGIEPKLAEGMMAAQAAGTYGCFASQTIAAGLFLLVPGIYYPLHTHPAEEIYYCLSGELEIQHGLEGTPFTIGAGEYSVTPPSRLHALRTKDVPVLIAYTWIGDLRGPNWWWDRDAHGRWQRTAWFRSPGKSWAPERTEPVTDATMAEAHA